MTTLTALTDAVDVNAFGGKAAGLAWLVQAGAPTPPGWVIGAAAFRAHLRRCGLDDAAAALSVDLPHLSAIALEDRSRALQDALRCAPLQPDVDAALDKVFRRRRPGTMLAVRSSAIDEDAHAASFAGQFASVLGIEGRDALRDAVRTVWASAFAAGALRYGQRRKLPPAQMAVVIQEQVDAQLSGVLFTRDPLCPDSGHLLLECCTGLGDRLVAGAINPARARIQRDSLRVEIDETGDDGVAFCATTQAAVIELAERALALERVRGQALDIEWSIDRSGRLLLLQCRPVTAGCSPCAARHLWSNANIAENFPGPVVPLLQSFVARGYAGYFRGLGAAFGISQRRIAAMAPALDALVGVHAGRLYYNLSHIHAVLMLAPGGRWLARFFDQFTGAEGAPAALQSGSGWVARATRALEVARVGCLVLWQCARVDKRVARFERRINAYAAATQPGDLRAASGLLLARHLQSFLDIRLHRWTDAALADAAAMVCYGLLKTVLERWLPNAGQQQLQNDVLQGLPGLASARPVEELWALAEHARRDAAALAALQQDSPERVLAALQAPACAVFSAAFDNYLAHWGFRYSGELMLTQPTPAEDPLPVIRLLQTYLAQAGCGPAQISAQRAAARVETSARIAVQLTPSRLLRRLPFACRADFFSRLLSATHGAIRLRERARMKQALLYTRLRLVLLALGDRLVAQQRLAARDDVFQLTIDEAIAAAGGGAVPSKGTVAARRAQFDSWQRLSPPDRLTLSVGAVWHAGPPAAAGTVPAPMCSTVLKGTGACGGRVVGPAAVILDVTQASGLAPGTILVTRQTDPGWASVFFLIKGLVVERGGMLSHGAIIAREYGIPATVGVRDATTVLKNGERLQVDGDAGQVERLDA